MVRFFMGRPDATHGLHVPVFDTAHPSKRNASIGEITPLPTSGTPHPPTVPPATVVFPTPPTPVPNAPLIAAEEAISIAMSQSPLWAQIQQRGELTVTTRLTVHGDTQAGATGVLTIPPQLPVWVVTMHMPPWSQPAGPAGRQVEVQFNAQRYELDAETGQWSVAVERSFRRCPHRQTQPTMSPTPLDV